MALVCGKASTDPAGTPAAASCTASAERALQLTDPRMRLIQSPRLLVEGFLMIARPMRHAFVVVHTRDAPVERRYATSCFSWSKRPAVPIAVRLASASTRASSAASSCSARALLTMKTAAHGKTVVSVRAIPIRTVAVAAGDVIAIAKASPTAASLLSNRSQDWVVSATKALTKEGDVVRRGDEP